VWGRGRKSAEGSYVEVRGRGGGRRIFVGTIIGLDLGHVAVRDKLQIGAGEP